MSIQKSKKLGRKELGSLYRVTKLKLIHNVFGQHDVVSFCHTFKGRSGFVWSKRVLGSQHLVHVFNDGIKWYCRLFCESPYEQLAHLTAKELIPNPESEKA